jgi:hypothetical protein
LDNQYNILSPLAAHIFSKENRMPSRFIIITLLFLALFPATVRAQQPSSRSMDDLNWQEFRQLVPAKIKTVILTVGTLEAHGFINNGADNTVPVGIFPTASPTFSRRILAACAFPKNRSASMSARFWWAW